MPAVLQPLFAGIRGYLIMARPYSFAEQVMLVLAAKAVAKGSFWPFEAADLLLATALLLLWLGFCWNLEATHRHENRPRVSPSIAFAALFSGYALLAALSPAAAPYGAAYIAGALLYSQKEGSSYFLGAFSFVARGASHAAAFMAAMLFFSPVISVTSAVLGLAVGVAIAARNLVGDLRDVKHDEKTFPVVFGTSTAIGLVVVAKLGAAIVFSSLAGQLAGFALAAEGLLQLGFKDNYKLHMLSVAGAQATYALVATLNLPEAQLAIVLLYLTALPLILFYDSVPRKSNHSQRVS